MRVLMHLAIGILLTQGSRAWGQEVAGHFYPENETYLVGEPIFVILEMTNASSRVIDLDDGHCATRFEVLTASRQVSPGARAMVGEGSSCGSTIAPWPPGATIRRRFLLALPFRLVVPGVYSIRAHHTVHVWPFDEHPQPATTEEIITDFEVSLSPVKQAESSPGQPQQGFEIQLPSDLKSEQVQIHYSLVGTFGGYSSFTRPESGKQSYRITTTVEGKEADSLKALVYGPSCQIAEISVPSLSRSSKKASFTCQALPSIPFSGKIQQVESLSGHEYEVEINLMVHWAMDFFGIADGFVPTFHIASVTPDKYGSFHIQLPDFTRDALTSSFGNGHASLHFMAREKRTGNILGMLQPTDVKYDQFGEMRLQSAYPDEVVFGVHAIR